jgi:hypothetical protein
MVWLYACTLWRLGSAALNPKTFYKSNTLGDRKKMPKFFEAPHANRPHAKASTLQLQNRSLPSAAPDFASCLQRRLHSPYARCRCGRGEPSPGADVAGVSPVPVQMWAGASPVPVQMWAG